MSGSNSNNRLQMNPVVEFSSSFSSPIHQEPTTTLGTMETWLPSKGTGSGNEHLQTYTQRMEPLLSIITLHAEKFHFEIERKQYKSIWILTHWRKCSFCWVIKMKQCRLSAVGLFWLVQVLRRCRIQGRYATISTEDDI